MRATSVLLAALVSLGCQSPLSPAPCVADGALGLQVTVTRSGTVEVEQTVLFHDVRGVPPPLRGRWIQHGVQAEELLSSDLGYLKPNPGGSADLAARMMLARTRPAHRQDVGAQTQYRPCGDTLLAGPTGPHRLARGPSVAFTIKYRARREARPIEERASFLLSLDIPTEIVEWRSLVYTRTPCFCNAWSVPVYVAVDAPAAVRVRDVAIHVIQHPGVSTSGSTGVDGSRWRLQERFSLDEQNPLLLRLTIPRKHVSAARSRSLGQAFWAWLYPDRSLTSFTLSLLISLALLRLLTKTARGSTARRVYLFLRVGAGNLALLAPLLLDAAEGFHLQRFGDVEWSIVAFSILLDLSAMTAILGSEVDRHVVAFLHRVGDDWPEPLVDQLLLARHAGREPDEIGKLAVIDLRVRNHDLMSAPAPTPTTEHLLNQLHENRRFLSDRDSALVARLQDGARSVLKVHIPLVNRLRRIRAGEARARTARRRVDAAFQKVMESVGQSPVYRSSHNDGSATYARVLRQELLWLLARPASAARLHNQLRQIEQLGGLNIEPIRSLRGPLDALGVR